MKSTIHEPRNMNKNVVRKTIKLIIVTIFTGIFSSAMASQDTVKIKTSAQCEACKKRIENALIFEKGVKNATLDVDTKIATVIYEKDKTNPDKLRTAISKAGYDADTIPANEKAYNKLPKCCKKGGMETH